MRTVHVLSASIVALLATACFGRVTVVPAAEAPPPPTGSGWFCYESIKPDRYRPSAMSHATACHRTAEDCTRAADRLRRAEPLTEVSSCAPTPKAVCTASFTGQSDAAWECYRTNEECAPRVGGVAGVPGMKQSQCAEYL
ncbi:MAG TPA: hypothetical protein VHB21_24565 [Minicystis sp.]|nr:hypothetical protein [Minicystis sp.]